MHTDVIELREFYASDLGKAAASSVSMALSAIWQSSPSDRLMGLGYPVPYLDRFAPDCGYSFCLMQAGQGALQWPSADHCATLMSYDDEFPLRDGSVDRIIMAHFLEHAENAHKCLSEAWRVLAPGGQIYMIVPNRRGVWARFETTPFGTGSPYSRGQLNRILRDVGFSPERWGDALHFAPSKREFSLRIWPSMEKFGRKVWPVFAGALIVVASKRLYQGIPVTAKSRRRLAVPVLVPQGTGRLNRD